MIYSETFNCPIDCFRITFSQAMSAIKRTTIATSDQDLVPGESCHIFKKACWQAARSLSSASAEPLAFRSKDALVDKISMLPLEDSTVAPAQSSEAGSADSCATPARRRATERASKSRTKRARLSIFSDASEGESVEVEVQGEASGSRQAPDRTHRGKIGKTGDGAEKTAKGKRAASTKEDTKSEIKAVCQEARDLVAAAAAFDGALQEKEKDINAVLGHLKTVKMRLTRVKRGCSLDPCDSDIDVVEEAGNMQEQLELLKSVVSLMKTRKLKTKPEEIAAVLARAKAVGMAVPSQAYAKAFDATCKTVLDELVSHWKDKKQWSSLGKAVRKLIVKEEPEGGIRSGVILNDLVEECSVTEVSEFQVRAINMIFVNLFNLKDNSDPQAPERLLAHLLGDLIETTEILPESLKHLALLLGLIPRTRDNLQQCVQLCSAGGCGSLGVFVKAFRLSSVGQRVLAKAKEACKTIDSQELLEIKACRMRASLAEIKQSKIETVHDHFDSWTPVIELRAFLRESAKHASDLKLFDDQFEEAVRHSLQHITAAGDTILLPALCLCT